MLTVDEAISLMASGVKVDPRVSGVQQFDFEKSAIWREFVCGMRLALKRCKRGKVGLYEVATHNVQLLHEVVCTNQTFKNAMQNAKRCTPQDRHWHAQQLIDHEQVHATLLSVHKGQPIPLHDHPAANGVLLVIEGRLQISRYNSIQTVNSDPGHVALSRISERILSLGEVDVLTEDRGNIHGMRSLAPRSIVLDILIPPHQSQTRSWYLPTGANMVNAAHLFARRVQGEYFLPLQN